MKTYTVRVTETYMVDFAIEAESEEDALDAARGEATDEEVMENLVEESNDVEEEEK